MARRLFVSLALVLVSLFATPARAQEQQTNPAGIWRMTYYHVKPGKMTDMMKDLREHFKASIEFSKSKGRVKEYKVLTNPTPASAEDWNYAIAVHYANWAARSERGVHEKAGRVPGQALWISGEARRRQ